ncbi:MAG: ACT domain-containing protein [Firmicutes bacterium]|nr:ACT domain-containing protein [Bacillota bacterium]MDD7601716.1 ACT domain-containing protein [Bacillota bacterium]MDY5855537.1 ACT domain-containing protein [Anaerovoracaceae bacterium]
MSIRQISIFVENQTGLLSEVTTLLADHGVNLRALSIADTSEFGILRIIVEDVDSAAALLREKGYTYTVTEVLAVSMRDEKGGLAEILKVLAEAGIALEYAYAFLLQKVGEACLIIRVPDNAAAEEALQAAGIGIATQEELF